LNRKKTEANGKKEKNVFFRKNKKLMKKKINKEKT